MLCLVRPFLLLSTSGTLMMDYAIGHTVEVRKQISSPPLLKAIALTQSIAFTDSRYRLMDGSRKLIRKNAAKAFTLISRLTLCFPVTANESNS